MCHLQKQLEEKNAQLQERLLAIQTQLENRDANILENESLLEKYRLEISNLEKQSIEQCQQLEFEKKNASEKIALLENAKKQLSDEFTLLANKIFEQKQTQFTQSSKAAVEASLKPMQNVLNDFKLRVETVHKEDVEGRASLAEQLKQLQEWGIEVHTQLVITPNVNDGELMRQSIEDLTAFWPTVRSISVVPVGLTKQHKYQMRPHTPRAC